MKNFRGSGGRVCRLLPLGSLIFAGLSTMVLADASRPLHFERIGTENGPPAEVITSVYQDRAGFLWVGSRDGLALYDGYGFTIFAHEPSDPSSISDNTIRTIFEDSKGDLWLGTNTGGLNRLDRTTGSFEHFRHDSADPGSLSHDSVYAILEDRRGDLWIGTQVGLNRLDRSTGRFQRFLSDPADPNSLSHDYVYALHEDGDGGLWVSTIGGGLNRRDPVTGAFTVFRHDPGDPESLTTDGVLAITEDTTGALWVSTMDGLNRMDRKTGKVRRFEYEPDGSGLSDPLVTALAWGPPGVLWIATHGGGLDRLDIETGEFDNWKHDPADRHSLGSNEIVALAADAEGTLWIGTWGGGLNRVTSSSLLLAESALLARMPENLDVMDVTGLMRDREDGLWIGTRTGDVVRRDLTRLFDRSYLTGGSLGTPRIILGFAEAADGTIWVASNGGILRLDSETGEYEVHAHDAKDTATIGPGYVNAMLVDRRGRLWVGTGEGGLHELDSAGRVVRRFRHDPTDPRSLSDDYVTVLYEDRRGLMWVGTRSGGLNALDPGSGVCRRYAPEAGNESTLSHHYVTSITEDRTGTLWVGTGGGGLDRVDRLEGGSLRFTRFTESDGLIDDNVMGVLEDDDGSLWISTKRGLTRFLPETGATLNLFVADGLPSGEFEPATVTRDRQTLYFGSVKGLVAIPTDTAVPARAPSPTVITSIRTSRGELRGKGPVWNLRELEVPWGEWLSLRFAVLDYGADRGHRYAYRLGDEDAEWIDMGNVREITYTDLDPGSYEFGVRGRNSQGMWSEANPLLGIRVVPPFWMTTWFRATALLFLVSLVVAGHLWRISAVDKRHRELVALHEQREKAREELGTAYARLRRLTHRLEAAKEDERQHIARELHDEMGPTLTAVIINLQLLARNPDSNRASEKIRDTIALVDRMVQRIRDLSLDLRPPLLDELGLVPALRGYLEAQGKRAEIDISVNADTEGHTLSPEAEITAFRVVQEAVTNVIRHSGARRATVTVHRDDGNLELSVKDDGRGFNVQDTMKGPAAKALGLLGMQERVHIMGGQVEIDSMPGRGTEIRVRVPVEVAP